MRRGGATIGTRSNEKSQTFGEAKAWQSAIVLRRLFRVHPCNMVNIFPVSSPDAQDFEPPLCSISLHLCKHAACHAVILCIEERPAVLFPQRILVPELESPVDEGRPIMVQIVDYEMLLSGRLGLAPRTGDSSVDLQDNIPVGTHCLAAGVERLSHAEAGSQDGCI